MSLRSSTTGFLLSNRLLFITIPLSQWSYLFWSLVFSVFLSALDIHFPFAFTTLMRHPDQNDREHLLTSSLVN